MNRYGRGPNIGGPSKATASTLCQKCLKRDIYECKTGAQERPYVSRPSRTQQFMNPKLMPKLTNDVPQDLLRKKGIADEQLAKAEQERGRKRERQIEDEEIGGISKRMRSASISSVSTISTNMSRSPSPRPAYRDQTQTKVKGEVASPRSQPFEGSIPHKAKSSSFSQSPPRQRLTDSEKKRRRDSVSSADSYISHDGEISGERSDSRNTRRRYQQMSPPGRGRRTESRSPHRERRRLSNDRPVGRNGFSNSGPPRRNDFKENLGPPRARSMSPFSKRLALTQAMNTGR